MGRILQAYPQRGVAVTRSIVDPTAVPISTSTLVEVRAARQTADCTLVEGEPSGVRHVRIFVASPDDTNHERSRVDRVVERLNGEFAGTARLESVRWETEFYRAHATFQAQIQAAAECDIVIAVFRHPAPPMVRLDDPEAEQVQRQWQRLKGFFDAWFVAADGRFKAAFQTFGTIDDFEAQLDRLLRGWLEDKVLHGRAVPWPIELKGSPFRGLAAFGVKHAPVFFGRSRDITRAVDQWKEAAARGMPFLLLIGASGAGKSSLARAGLVPRLTAPGVVPAVDLWRVAVMQPSEASDGPVMSLAMCLFDNEQVIPDDEQGRPPALPEIRDSDFPTPAQLARLFAEAGSAASAPV